MKVLIAGDSITEGKLGFNYVDILKEKFPQTTFVNLGLGGDTLFGIGNRILNELRHETYDIIIIEAGHNDLILQEMKKMSFIYKLTTKWIIHRGSVPTTDPNEFQNLYNNLIKRIKAISKAKIIVTSLSCLGENLSTPLNEKRTKYNTIIQKAANDQNCIFVDINSRFENFLKSKHTSNQFLGNYSNVFIFDPPKTNTVESVTNLSNSRGLYLTVDGCHLNYNGATIYADELCIALTTLSSTTNLAVDEKRTTK